MRKAAHNILAWVALALAGGFLIVDAIIVIPQRMTEGGGAFRALVFWMSYFSVWSVTSMMLVWFATAGKRRRLRQLTGATARTLVAGNALALLVASPLGLFPQVALPDSPIGIVLFGMHVILPILYLVWWVTGPHPIELRWSRAAIMLLYPAGYLLWIFFRGIAISRWPYGYFDLETLGATRYLLNNLLFLVAFAVIYLAVIAASRELHNRSRAVTFLQPRRG